MEYFLQISIAGLLVGGVYALIAIGFVLINKATGILNMAQGGMVALGAFVCFGFSVQLGLPFLLALVLTLLVSFFLGIMLAKIFFRPMIGQPIFASLMMTLALYMILEGLTISLWGADLRRYPGVLPSKPLIVRDIVIPYDMLAAFGVAVLLLVVFILFFKFSHFGARIRAVADDQAAAQAAGIRVRRIFEFSWGLGNTIAALGGIALGMITMLSPAMSYFGMKVLPVVILGGLESITGAIIGGLIIGLLEGLAGGYLEMQMTGTQEVAPFVILILFLLLKPHGLFGLKRIERI
ncbi:MAG: branched-chain amino acid ABC transporter permease [Pseudomonadota bacterium]